MQERVLFLYTNNDLYKKEIKNNNFINNSIKKNNIHRDKFNQVDKITVYREL